MTLYYYRQIMFYLHDRFDNNRTLILLIRFLDMSIFFDISDYFLTNSIILIKQENEVIRIK